MSQSLSVCFLFFGNKMSSNSVFRMLKILFGGVWSLVLSRVVYVFRSFCAHRKIAFSQTIFYSQQKNEAKRAEMTDRISSLLAFLTYGLLNGTPSSFLFQLQNAELLSFCKGKDEVL